jgi:hypothetical protein
MSGPNPKHGQAPEADVDNNEALLASGPAPKHGAALSAGTVVDGTVEPESGSQEVNV